jgi:hypothetical protein
MVELENLKPQCLGHENTVLRLAMVDYQAVSVCAINENPVTFIYFIPKNTAFYTKNIFSFILDFFLILFM